MQITSALVLYAVIWFMVLFLAIQFRITSQEESGEIVPGTPASAPVNLQMKKRLLWVTGISLALWVPICAVIISGVITVESIDIFNRYGDGHYGAGD
ncbi:DUF1467 family protein [Rhodovulum sp. YNF3179]|uniref:DUF1467 family protein n=1 Tax=Rhodovulum sp. YNF3179 TaxID=3425127 RepID=UPI003D3595E3